MTSTVQESQVNMDAPYWETGDVSMRMLLVEDDQTTLKYTSRALSQAGHLIDCFTDGRKAMEQCMQVNYDVLILDRKVPGIDGLSLLKGLRDSGIKTPALFVTALSSKADRMDGRKAGGDDYLTKPFAFSELLARVNALACGSTKFAESTLSVADLNIDLKKRTATRAGTTIELHPREFLLLEVLMRNAGRVVSKSMLLEQVWNFHFDLKTRVVETHVRRLRSKIDKPFTTSLVHTVKNFGYGIKDPF